MDNKKKVNGRRQTREWLIQFLFQLDFNPEPVDIALPFTVGLWDTTEPVQIELVEGENVLRFTRNGALKEVAEKGITIRDFTLKPVR